jgi:resuscitation-promoting factor RpfB
MKKKQIESLKKSSPPQTSRFFLSHPFVVPVVVFLLIFILGMMFLIGLGGTTQGAEDARIVNVFADGKQQTVTTRAKNVSDLLSRLSIQLADEDIVEPSRDTVIIEDNTQVNVYRARPVKIIDGERIITVLSAQRSPRLVAVDAGLELFAEDEIGPERNDTSVLESGVGETLKVTRSVEVQMSVFGVLATVRTTAQTLDELLSKQDIRLSVGETTQPEDLQTPINSGMFISVNAPGKKTLAINEPIPYDRTIENDPNVPAGTTAIKQAGLAGERAVIYEIEERDGIEVGRRELQTIVLRVPTTEIRSRGTQAIASFSVSGDKQALMRAAGISDADFGAVDYIIQKESNWRPAAINAGGCIGLGQRCPSRGTNALAQACPSWQTDPVCQLQHFSAYSARYGGWQGAYQAWLNQGWW